MKIQSRAADMANAFGEELDKLQQEIARSDANNQLAFLEQGKVPRPASNLTHAEEALRNFSEKSSVIQIDAQAKGMIEYIAQLRAAIDGKEVQIQVVRQSATPSNYDLIRLETELKGLRDKLRCMPKSRPIKIVWVMFALPPARCLTWGWNTSDLYREVKYQEVIYQLFSKMVEIARLDAARNAMVSTIQFVDKAQPPERKSKPKRLTTAILVGLVSFIIMVFVAFGREFWQNSTTIGSGGSPP